MRRNYRLAFTLITSVAWAAAAIFLFCSLDTCNFQDLAHVKRLGAKEEALTGLQAQAGSKTNKERQP
eukprot:1149923-Pelagomonas_calceolata.AAC.8